MNDNEPLMDAERDLISFYSSRFSSSIAAQRSSVRAHIMLRAKRYHIRRILLFIYKIIFYSKITALSLLGASVCVAAFNIRDGLGNYLPLFLFICASLAVIFSVEAGERKFGKALLRGANFFNQRNWAFELSCNFKNEYKEDMWKLIKNRKINIL